MLTVSEAVVEERASLREHTAPVHGVVLAQPWVPLGTLSVLAGEAVASATGVDLDTLIGKFAVAVLVELAYSSHSDF